MKRRTALQSMVGIPAAASALAAQEPPKPPVGIIETPKTQVTGADAVADQVHRFFTPAEFSAMEKLAELMYPAAGDTPGAKECGVPAFLDFLLSKSPADRQSLYRAGLTILNTEAEKRYHNGFGELDASKAAPILAPLRQPWTYGGPEDPLGRFLVAVKADLIDGTQNSRDYIIAISQRRRGAGGLGTYWYPVE